MLSNVDSLLNKMVEILWNLRSESVLFQNSKDFASCDSLNLWDTVIVSENNTNLGWRASFLGHFDNLLNQVIRGDLDPTGRPSSVR